MTAPSHTTESIERELAALGEPPPSAEELALLGESGEFSSDDLASERDEPVAFVSRTIELAAPLAFEDLSELELHRGWRTVEQRVGRPVAARPIDSSTSEPVHPHRGVQRWLFAGVGIAAAAALVLIVVWPERPDPDTEIDPEQIAELGDQARATLAALDDGASDTQRAERSAADYQTRLEEQHP